jgi:hypothetical protein
MKQKLFPNIRRMTNLFCLGIFCVTLSVLALRLTVFSDMAASAPSETVSSMVENEQSGYRINGKPVFATADSKGDVFISNMEDNAFSINVDITLKENGKSIFTSGLIKPGDSVDSKKMNPVGQALEDGLYECVAEIIAHDSDSLKPVGSAKEEIVVQIGKTEEDGKNDDKKADDKKEKETEDETEEPTEEDATEDAVEEETEETADANDEN